MTNMPILLVYLVAYDDKKWCERLDKQLSAFNLQEAFITWSSQQTSAGSEWQKEMETQLKDATIVVPLVSSNLLADKVYSEIIRKLVNSQKRVIPVLLREVEWESLLKNCTPLPLSRKFIVSQRYPDTILKEIAKEIYARINNIQQHNINNHISNIVTLNDHAAVFQLSRRQALQEQLKKSEEWLASYKLSLKEIITHCTTGIEACWSIFYEGGQSESQRCLEFYRQKVAKMAQAPGLQQNRQKLSIFALASQACQLQCMLESQKGCFESAFYWGKKAIEYADLTGEPDLKAASLLRQSIIYWYKKDFQHIIETIQKMLLPSKDISPILEAIAYGQLAEAYASLRETRKALIYKERACKAFPQGFENDPAFSYTRFNLFSLHENIGSTYLQLGQHKKAWDELEKIGTVSPRIEIPQQAELWVRKVQFSFAWGDLDLSCSSIEEAIKLAKVSSAQPILFHELRAIYPQMQAKWRYERKVLELKDHFL